MSSVLLLLLAAATSEVTATSPETSTGLNFLVAFPENIAYYHPVAAQNMVQVTALGNDTVVTIKSSTDDHTMNLSPGQSENYTLVKTENQKYGVDDLSYEVLKITSDELITVHAINMRQNSVQTALVLPTDKLAKEYFIPPIPEIEGTTVPADMVSFLVTERGPFRLVIINGGNSENSVTVKGEHDEKFNLQSNQMKIIWLTEAKYLQSVKAKDPVAVLFGHSCALQSDCTCGQLFASLPPAKEETLKFYIPPTLANETKAFVLVSDGTSPRKEPFNPDQPLVETAGAAIFYHPGLLLTLIPETDFAACYVVHSVSDTHNYAFIVVHKDFTDGVHVGSRRLVNQWQDLKGTDYVSTSFVLESGKSVIWHASSRMAVYFMGRKDLSWFGNPAASISTSPDFRGCVLSPEVITIGEVAVGWRESVQYCSDQGMELVSITEAQHQSQIYRKLLRAQSNSLQEMWIGMRRSSQSGEWYWLNKAPVNGTDWEDGEPGTVDDGQCAVMRLHQNEDFGWSDKDCCEAALPICYRKPILLGKP